MLTSIQLVEKLKDIAKNYKTLYVMGCFGSPMTPTNKTRYCNNHEYNRKAARTKMINSATADTFGFDCVCLIKAVLWGWTGNKNHTYGGAVYGSNGVPDVSANGLIAKCQNVTTDFSKIEVGEVVWMSGHVGVYIGDGLAVECTPSWDNKVQITACNCKKSGYNTRTWTKHGKLPYVTYVAPTPAPAKKTNEEIADEVLAGKWGNGEDRKARLKKAGYNPTEIQKIVNDKVAKKSTPTTTTTTPTYKTHTVVKGDSLWNIAAKYLGNGARYPEIKKLNGLTSDTIHAGQKLKIPK